jgi:hypothetical protein
MLLPKDVMESTVIVGPPVEDHQIAGFKSCSQFAPLIRAIVWQPLVESKRMRRSAPKEGHFRGYCGASKPMTGERSDKPQGRPAPGGAQPTWPLLVSPELLKCKTFENSPLVDFLQQRVGENRVACVKGCVFGPLGVWQRFREGSPGGAGTSSRSMIHLPGVGIPGR